MTELYQRERICGCGAVFIPKPKAIGRNRYRCLPCNATAARTYRERNAGRVSHAERARAGRPERAKKVKEWSRKSKLRAKYGLTPEEYEALLGSQQGACAICLNPETAAASRPDPHLGDRRVRRLAVDHDHKTGDVRGLLCMNCNRAIGFLQENAELAMRLAEYLTRSNTRS